MKIQIEHTDTFGGEANYCWVNRETIELDNNATDRQIVIAAKKVLGMTGVKCRKEDWSDTLVLRPIGIHQIIFITFEEN